MDDDDDNGVKATASAATVEEDLVRAAAIRGIESSGFTPASFSSSASDKVTKIALPGEPGSSSNGFAFGTAAEKSAGGTFLAQISREGLCHPSWFPSDAKEREARWTKHLFELRRKLVKERRAQQK